MFLCRIISEIRRDTGSKLEPTPPVFGTVFGTLVVVGGDAIIGISPESLPPKELES